MSMFNEGNGSHNRPHQPVPMPSVQMPGQPQGQPPGQPQGPQSQSPQSQSPGQPAPIPKCAAMGQRCAYLFAYQPDITPAELAASMEIIMFGFAAMAAKAPPQFVDQLYDALDERTRRHWQVHELKQLPSKPQIAVPKKPKGGLYLPPGAKG
jgi:hypothetical protein